MAEQKKDESGAKSGSGGQQAQRRPSVLEDKEEFTKDRVHHMGDEPNLPKEKDKDKEQKQR